MWHGAGHLATWILSLPPRKWEAMIPILFQLTRLCKNKKKNISRWTMNVKVLYNLQVFKFHTNVLPNFASLTLHTLWSHSFFPLVSWSVLFIILYGNPLPYIYSHIYISYVLCMYKHIITLSHVYICLYYIAMYIYAYIYLNICINSSCLLDSESPAPAGGRFHIFPSFLYHPLLSTCPHPRNTCHYNSH